MGHKLTNKDISDNYKNIVLYLLPSEFLGAFAYWVTYQNPNEEHIDLLPSLETFERHVFSYFANPRMPEKFTYSRLQEVINEKEFEAMIPILRLNELKPDFIDLGALARNVFFMILREHITQD